MRKADAIRCEKAGKRRERQKLRAKRGGDVKKAFANTVRLAEFSFIQDFCGGRRVLKNVLTGRKRDRQHH